MPVEKMKNKHLVLLFLLVLASGFIARWLPIQYRSFFQTKLVKIDAAFVNRIVLEIPKQPALTFEKAGGKWIAEQGGRTTAVPNNEVAKLITQLAGITAFQTVKTALPDTLGFSPEQIIRVALSEPGGKTEQLEIGMDQYAVGQAVTYLRLPSHSGIYQVPGHLRKHFFRKLNDFRNKTVLQFDRDSIQKIGIQPAGKLPVYLNAADSLGRWLVANSAYSIAADSVLSWLNIVKRLEHCRFADYFDESRSAETLHTTIYLGQASGRFLTLRFFYVRPPNMPEDLSRARSADLQNLPVYIVQSSQNPANYFAVPDTLLAAYLCGGLLPEPTLVKNRFSEKD